MAGGYEVVVTRTDALQLMDQVHPQVLLIDVTTPSLSAEDAGKLLTRAAADRIPVVGLSELNKPIHCEWALAEIRHFLYCPCRPRTMIARIEDAIHSSY